MQKSKSSMYQNDEEVMRKSVGQAGYAFNLHQLKNEQNTGQMVIVILNHFLIRVRQQF